VAHRVRERRPVPADAGLVRRRLANELKQARAAAGLSHPQVAAHLGVALTTILRIEGATMSVSEPTAIALGRLYGTASDIVQRWRQMGTQSRRQPFGSYRDVLPATYRHYLAVESMAVRIVQWAPMLVPELLQSPAYTHTVTQTVTTTTTTDAAEQVVARRATLTAARQTALLEQPSPPRLEIFLDEGVLERLARGPDVMLDQLEHLRRYVDHPRVTIQIAGHASGLHRGLLGGFTILEFGSGDPPLAFTHPQPYTANEASEQLAGFQDLIQALTAVATHPKQLDEIIDSCLGLNPFEFGAIP